MLEALTELDSQVFLAVHQALRCTYLDRAMMLFTGRFIWVPMYAALLALFLRDRDRRLGIVLTVACALAITLTDQTCATIIRPMVERLRPSNPGNPLSAFVTVINNYRGGAYGFPSCHAANSFALAVFASLTVRRGGFIAFIFAWAVVNSYSRLYLGVHYPGDLLVGAVIGAVFGAVCYAAAVALCRRMDGAVRPGVLADRLNAPFGTVPGVCRLTAPGMVMLVGAATVVVILIASLG